LAEAQTHGPARNARCEEFGGGGNPTITEGVIFIFCADSFTEGPELLNGVFTARQYHDLF